MSVLQHFLCSDQRAKLTSVSLSTFAGILPCKEWTPGSARVAAARGKLFLKFVAPRSELQLRDLITVQPIPNPGS